MLIHIFICKLYEFKHLSVCREKKWLSNPLSANLKDPAVVPSSTAEFHSELQHESFCILQNEAN